MNSAPTPPDEARSVFRRQVIVWCAVGLALRLGLLLLSGEPELTSDEAGYVYLALGWTRFDFLGDAERFLWPPAWPFVLRTAFECFGRDGLFAAKLFSVGVSLAPGLGVIGLARRLGSARAGVIAGAIWALYLPLAAFTHLLWAEPLFLALFTPGLYFLVAAEQEEHPGRSDRRLFLAGLLLGASLLVKEAPTYLIPLLVLGLLFSRRGAAFVERFRRAVLLALAVIAVVLPWSARNFEVYGRVAPVGISIGENVYGSLNSRYTNFDLRAVSRIRGERPKLESIGRPAFVAVDPRKEWQRADEPPNTAARSAENVRRGLDWARENPEDLLRTRVKKLADLFLPTSFFVRQQGCLTYSEAPLGRPVLRRPLVVWALLCPLLLLLLSVPGAVQQVRRLRCSRGTWIPIVVFLYVLGTCLLSSMSRLRVPMLPVLFVFVATFLALDRWRWFAGKRTRLAMGAGWVLLFFLWWVDFPELQALVRLAWTS